MTSEAPGQGKCAGGVTVAVILCAGQGTRMQADRNKALLPLLGRPLIAHTLVAFERAASVDEILLVAHPDEVGYFAHEVIPVAGASKVSGVIAGGATRHQSEQCALDALRERITTGEIALVMIHDGARPLVTPEEIDQLAEVAREGAGAILVTPYCGVRNAARNTARRSCCARLGAGRVGARADAAGLRRATAARGV